MERALGVGRPAGGGRLRWAGGSEEEKVSDVRKVLFFTECFMALFNIYVIIQFIISRLFNS